MSLKLKLNRRPSLDGRTQHASTPDEAVPPTPSSTVSSGAPKLKLSVSQPPTPATEHAPVSASTSKKKQQQLPRPAGAKAGPGTGKKRAANDDISPAAKRTAKVIEAGGSLARRLSIKPPTTPAVMPKITSASSINRIRLGLGQRKPSIPKITSINVKRPPPPREPGVGYDSEDSEAETDPAIQQAFVLRMQPGEDCDFLRESIANGKIGASTAEGGVGVSIRFLDSHYRRAIITIRGRKYGAALVDLPCIVETMKSWDKKGWWKVADICQMLLVLGQCNTDDEARNLELPHEVNKNNMQFAHGLTPPMRWVRKRRFRKRPSYKDMANVEEEVERLLKEDDEAVQRGGETKSEVLDRAEAERERSRSHYGEDEDEDADADADGEAMETVENDGEYAQDYDEDGDGDGADLEGDLQAMFDRQEDDEPTSAIVESPIPFVDQVASTVAMENEMNAASPSVPATPVETPGAGPSPDDDGSEDDEDDDDDDDDDDDEDSPDVMDEDAIARAAERNQQLEEVADLEREVEKQRAKAAGMKNQLLKEKALAQLLTLEEELRTKRAVFGLETDD